MPSILPYDQGLADEYISRYGHSTWQKISDWEMSRRLIADAKKKEEMNEAIKRKATTITNKGTMAESALGGKKRYNKSRKTTRKPIRKHRKTTRRH